MSEQEFQARVDRMVDAAREVPLSSEGAHYYDAARGDWVCKYCGLSTDSCECRLLPRCELCGGECAAMGDNLCERCGSAEDGHYRDVMDQVHDDR